MGETWQVGHRGEPGLSANPGGHQAASAWELAWIALGRPLGVGQAESLGSPPVQVRRLEAAPGRQQTLGSWPGPSWGDLWEWAGGELLGAHLSR